MLYATTRSKNDSYTAHRTLTEDRAPDGGFYLPFRMPICDKNQIEKLKDQSFGENVAQILNLFFSARITGWDVDCCIGKSAAKILPMSHRVLLAQLWDNPMGDFSYICDTLYKKLCVDHPALKATNWANTAIRIAVLFGVCGMLQKMNIHSFDVAIASGDFTSVMAIWYARQMGLPVGTIVCACNENNAPWDLLHRGEMNTGMSLVHTFTEELDASNPAGLERLIFGVFGLDETQKYLSVSNKKGIYQIRPDMTEQLSKGMFVSVVGKDRVEPVITSVYRSNNCILDPYTAVAYGGLQDYRAKTGESCATVLLWEKKPTNFMDCIRRATGLRDGQIESLLNQI